MQRHVLILRVNSNNSAPSIRCRSTVNEAIDSEWNITTGLFGLSPCLFCQYLQTEVKGFTNAHTR